MGRLEPGKINNRNAMRSATKASLPDSALGSLRELDALFDQSPVAMVFGDPELRARRGG
jgi:hypothetical protein